MNDTTKRIYAYIKKGKFKSKIGLILRGSLDEEILQYPMGWYELIDEKIMAKNLIDSMQNNNLNQVLGQFLNMSDASHLISKYMGEFGLREFQGGCCG